MSSGLKITVPSYAFTVDKTILRKTLRSAGAEVASVARSLIRKSQKSTPGEPPVNRTGNLAGHIVVKMTRNREGVIVQDTAESARGSHAPYALFLEDGATGGVGSGKKGAKGRRNVRKRIGGKSILVQVVGSRILLPHPFLSVALAQRESSIATRVQAAIVDGVAFKKVKA